MLEKVLKSCIGKIMIVVMIVVDFQFRSRANEEKIFSKQARESHINISKLKIRLIKMKWFILVLN